MYENHQSFQNGKNIEKGPVRSPKFFSVQLDHPVGAQISRLKIYNPVNMNLLTFSSGGAGGKMFAPSHCIKSNSKISIEERSKLFYVSIVICVFTTQLSFWPSKWLGGLQIKNKTTLSSA